jgi:tRNA (guanine10-N2)-methyltransferase
MTEVIQSLITFARYLLKPKGRLVFFLPTEKATYNVDDIPRIEGMRIVSNSLQDYGSWGRRLITIEKIGDMKEERLDRGIDRNLLERGVNVTGAEGHRDFREKYMAGFKLGQNELE